MRQSIIHWRPYLLAGGFLAIVWIASEFIVVAYRQRPAGYTWQCGLGDGEIWVDREFWSAYRPPSGLLMYRARGPLGYGLRLPYYQLSPNSPVRNMGAVLPLWVILLTLFLLGGWKWRARLRDTAIHCRECGYNLTGNVSGICPECGVVVSVDAGEKAA
jgi:hypothetical protein